MPEMTGRPATQPDYGIGALARRLGMAPATLRDWERRYGIGPGGRTAGGHRRYRPADVARIESMRRLILDGVPPAEAARVALAPGTEPELYPTEPGPTEPGPPGRGAGGRSLALPAQRREARGLARAALAMDGPAIAGAVRRSLDLRGAAATWQRLAVPVLTAVGERSAATGSCIDVEHLLSAHLMTALADRAGRLADPVNPRTVLLACADDEQHSLPLYALAASLAELRVGTTMLGARTPPAALAETVSRIGPAAVFVWSQIADTGDPAQLAGLPRQRPPLRLLAAGPGWRGTPAGALRVSTLPDAIEQAREAVGLA
ncbi:MAG TPA: MerR family transcriptional regulator [Streptosporangiaceae bacterium]|nr:MerR family transcriptional regulator [Streptosporangiaceae bacterium]